MSVGNKHHAADFCSTGSVDYHGLEYDLLYFTCEATNWTHCSYSAGVLCLTFQHRYSAVAGVTSSGLNCVRFGLVTADTDLEELIAIVYANGKQVEESSKVGSSSSQFV